MAWTAQDWDPGTYARFRGLRSRPALDLLMQVGSLPAGDIVDLGCGDGAAAAALRTRFSDRQIIGVDASPAMLALARGYDATILSDAATWEPATSPALIFSNALLQWLTDHAALFLQLVSFLPTGGTLAIQMPRQYDAPSHRLMRTIGAAMFPDRFDSMGLQAPVHEPAFYHRLLSPTGETNVWETEYLQRLAPVSQGHPVRHFTQSTALRPYAERLDPDELSRFITAYESGLNDAYPAEPDGSVLFPFRRLFLTLTKG